MIPLTEDEILCGVRRVSQTHDGRPVGFKEKLDRSDPNIQRVFKLAALAKGRAALAAKRARGKGK